MTKLQLALVAAGLAVSISAWQAEASITDLPAADGYGRFRDNNSGRVWLDLNNFFNKTYNQMAATATTLGYTLATESDVAALVNTLPLGGGQWPTYASVMGSALGLIWGGYDSGQNTVIGFGYSFSSGSTWQLDSSIAWPKNTVPNGGSSAAVMDIWAYKAVAVPEPSTYLAGALMLVPFALQGIRHIRNRKS